MPLLEVASLSNLRLLPAHRQYFLRRERRHIMVIVGGSGCGKTTTLRCIGRLEDRQRTSGRWSVIASEDQRCTGSTRQSVWFFQSYALWPHMSVYQNVAMGWRACGMRDQQPTRNWSRGVLKQSISPVLATAILRPGAAVQQQRVALARSAVVKPKLLLLDEPLSNLDAKLREQMRDELREMIKMFAMTASTSPTTKARLWRSPTRYLHARRPHRTEGLGAGTLPSAGQSFRRGFHRRRLLCRGHIVGAPRDGGIVPVTDFRKF